MTDGWLVIPNWEKWQSRRDRHDPWIKSYIDQLDRPEYLRLSLTERGLLHDLRLLFSRTNGQLPLDIARNYVGRYTRDSHWESLVHAGYIDISAAKPPPIGGSRARREREEEEDSPKSPHRKNGRGPKRTGYRMVRGTHGVSYVQDPDGVDPLPTGWQG